ncbi:MAG: hypothetical protein F6K11_12985 [Leptolyngbya sp. SIO3F4]|nr:hypothetical protein [Leptolyngbya sp. SIO3F4]
MAEVSDNLKDLQRYILQAQQPVICNADALKAMPQDKKTLEASRPNDNVLL